MPDWIDIKIHEPKPKQKCIVACTFAGVITATYKGKGKFTAMKGFKTDTVTHWMKAPELPKL